MPSLTVNNLQQSLDFFGGLGFEIEDRWEEDGKLLGAMLKAGEARLGLSQDVIALTKEPFVASIASCPSWLDPVT